MESMHYTEDRKDRENLVKTIGAGKVVLSVRWDRGHKNGAEIHKVTDTGLIFIYNEKSGEHITTLIARPQQVQRYFDMVGKQANKELLEIARRHQQLGYNLK